MKVEIGVEPEIESVVLIALLYDMSGSMTGNRIEVIGSGNSFVSTITKEQEGKQAFVSTFVFDSNGVDPILRTIQNGAKLTDYIPLSEDNYTPRGGTPLYDAIGQALVAIDVVVKEKGVNKVTFVIQTDGEENSSKEFSLSRVKEEIEKRNNIGWQIIFLGADLSNAHDIGRGLGVMAANSMSYSKGATGQTYDVMAASTRAYRFAPASASVASSGLNMSEEDKKKLHKKT